MQVGKPRPKSCRILAARAGISCGAAVLLLLSGSRGLQNAVAEGDTRSITMHHMHTSEDITITFKREGRYDESALEKLNWFLRDWRKQQETKMDPHLIDLIWEVHRESGSNEPIWVVCGYRSPETNAMLRRRSSGVARFSQHMLGHAMDFYIPGVPLDKLRVMGMRLQRGGVGFYPTSGSPFVHMDTGGVRMWPRMSREQLVRVFPDQRTVYLPSNGGPLAGYDLALADIRKRGSDVSSDVGDGELGSSNPITKLFHLARGGGQEEEADGAAATPQPSTTESLKAKTKAAVAKTVSRAEEKLAAQKAKVADAAARAEEKLTAQKAKLAQVAARAEEKLAAEKTKLAQVAAQAKEKLAAGRDKLAKVAAKANVFSRTETPANPAAATDSNQVVLARGIWQGSPDGAAASGTSQGATSAIAAVAQPSRVNVASTEDTGSIGASPAGQIDRVAPETALAYAAEQDASAESPGDGRHADRTAAQRRRATGRQRNNHRQADAGPAERENRHCGNEEDGDRARGREPAQRSLAARRRRFAERESLPLHHHDGRARLPLSLGFDGQAGQLGDDAVCGRPKSRPDARSFQRQRRSVSAAHRAASVIAASFVH